MSGCRRSAGDPRKDRGEVRRSTVGPEAIQWTGRGGSVPTCGACLPRGGVSAASFRTDAQRPGELKRVAQMGSWQPKYLDVDPSEERLAETVIKLEREVYRIKRPHGLANRGVFVRTGEPIDLGPLVPAYLRDGQSVRHRIAEQLRDTIQALINTLASAPPPTGGAETDVPEGGPRLPAR